MTPKTIYIIAGEESGDVLGGRLMHAMKQKGDFQFYGIGDASMTAQGLSSLFPMNDLSVMGIFEILPRLPKLVRNVYKCVDEIVDKQPDLVITIDSPDFSKPVVKRAKRHCPNTKFIHYVAPTVWAWRAGRAKTMASLYDGLICLLPFEPPYFDAVGLTAQFCGHPIVETIDNIKIKRSNDHILILPGSRLGEVKKMAPIFAETFMRMKAMNPDLKAIIPALPHLKDEIDDHFFGMDVTYIDPERRFSAFKNAPFAIATSGTVGLELAVAGCPHVIAYKMNPLTWWLIKRLVKVKHAHLVNIMEGREVIPECIQNDCHSDAILNAVIKYPNPDLSALRHKLAGADTTTPPSMQAAEFILGFL